MSVCPGRCNAAYRRALAAGDPDPIPVKGDPCWCMGCARMIQEALRLMPLAYQALDAVAFMSRDPSEPVSGSKAPASPSPGGDAQDEMLRTICSWEDDFRFWAKYNRSPQHHWQYRPGAGHDLLTPLLTLEAACLYLNGNFGLMMQREECAIEFGGEILSLFTRTQAMVKNGPRRIHLHLPCPRCDMMSVIQEEGVAGRPWYLTCPETAGGCGSLYTPEEWDWWVEVLKARASLSRGKKKR